MQCPRMDHFGFSVGIARRAQGIADRAEAFREPRRPARPDRPARRRSGRGQDPLALRALHPAHDVRVPVLGIRLVARWHTKKQHPVRPSWRHAVPRICTGPETPLLMPNAWDIGSAVLLAALGFEALATTSGGFAASKGRLDGAMTATKCSRTHGTGRGHRAAPLGRPRELLRRRTRGCGRDGTRRPRSRRGRVLGGGLHRQRGGSDLRDRAGRGTGARRRAEAAHDGERHIVVTARAENYLHGRPDLADTIARLQAYQAAGRTWCSRPGWTIPASSATGRRGRRPGQRAGGAQRAERGRVVGVGREPDFGRRRLRRGGVRRPRRCGHRTTRAGTYGYWELTKRGPGRADAFSAER